MTDSRYLVVGPFWFHVAPRKDPDWCMHNDDQVAMISLNIGSVNVGVSWGWHDLPRCARQWSGAPLKEPEGDRTVKDRLDI